ncbi:MAG: GNAT family N-acetyltransferase [Candidatus Omnitrophica bacterium]|nr:GNAT family N-acetyltransferase [Candidatus Omnitrophota bacterium]
MSKKPSLAAPALLQTSHCVSDFDCGNQALNTYLKRYAIINNQNGSAKTYVTARGNQVIGYYTLTIGSVSKQDAPLRVGKGLAGYPVPVVIIARLAVDKTEQGSGIGRALLQEALLRVTYAADSIGGRAVLVHAKDQAARSFYEYFGFQRSPIDEFHLYLLLKDIEKTLKIKTV